LVTPTPSISSLNLIIQMEFSLLQRGFEVGALVALLLGLAVMGSTTKDKIAQKRNLHLLGFSTFLLTTCAQQGPSFTASLSEPRRSLAATSVGHLALFAGGGLPLSNRVDIYNSLTDSWTTA